MGKVLRLGQLIRYVLSELKSKNSLMIIRGFTSVVILIT